MSDKKQVLIIEDDDKLSQIFAYALRALNLEITIIADGRAAREKLQTAVPDLILLDLHLPHLSGTDLLQELERDGRHKHTKLIITTADSHLADQITVPVDHILHKPISVLNLQRVVRRLFDVDHT